MFSDHNTLLHAQHYREERNLSLNPEKAYETANSHPRPLPTSLLSTFTILSSVKLGQAAASQLHADTAPNAACSLLLPRYFQHHQMYFVLAVGNWRPLLVQF